MQLSIKSCKEINKFIQEKGKGVYFDARKAVSIFSELAPLYHASKNSKDPFGLVFYVCFQNDEVSFQTSSYDDASDFLFDVKGSKGFSFDYLTGLQVMADQQ